MVATKNTFLLSGVYAGIYTFSRSRRQTLELPKMKIVSPTSSIRTSAKLREVAAKLLGRLPMPGKNGEMGLVSELQASNDEVAMAFVEKVRPG